MFADASNGVIGFKFSTTFFGFWTLLSSVSSKPSTLYADFSSLSTLYIECAISLIPIKRSASINLAAAILLNSKLSF